MKNSMGIEAGILGNQRRGGETVKVVVLYPEDVAFLLVRDDRLSQPLVDNNVFFLGFRRVKWFGFGSVGKERCGPLRSMFVSIFSDKKN